MKIFSLTHRRLTKYAFAAFAGYIVLAAAHSASTSTQTAIPAFPGASGFGANSPGGRGGNVYIVTNLNDSGPGSFRDAVSQPNRYVVFAVGGMIRSSSRIQVAPNLTIAGQTAPGEGITIYGNGISFSNANNTITRYLRIRMGVVGDGGADAVTVAQGDNMIFDHVSVSWGRDETFSVSGTASNITVQDSIIAQGLHSHSAGGLMETSGGVSIIRCLYIDNTTRNPKVKGVNEFVNNVVYNWGTGGGYILGDSAGQSFVNVIENYFIDGPSTGIQPFTRGNLNFHIYASNNYRDINRNGSLDGAVLQQSEYTTVDWMSSPFPYPSQSALPAAEAYSLVVANAGASRVRDRVDRRLIEEVSSLGTLGQIISNESDPPMSWQSSPAGSAPAPAAAAAPSDTDSDGMPDEWELAVGLDPNVADHNGDGDNNGYTNLEDYLNALVPGGVQEVFITNVSDDTGLSSTDAITSDDSLTLMGTARPGTTLKVSRLGTGMIGTVAAGASGGWSLDLTAPLAEGLHAFTATATDESGNNPPTPAFMVTVDRTGPAAPMINSVNLGTELFISGISEPGSEVQVGLVGGSSIGVALANEGGLWSVAGTTLDTGVHSFIAVATDKAGNMGAISAPYVVDASIAAPIVSSVSDDTGQSPNDRLTNDTTLILSGTAPSGTTVTVARTGAGPLGTVPVASDGRWVFDYSTTVLPPGAYTFSATATASSGNSSPASAPFLVLVDTVAPAVSAILRQNPQSAATTASSFTFRVSFSEQVSGVDMSDFLLTATGSSTGIISAITPLSGQAFDILVVDVSGEGTLRLDLISGATGIIDGAANVTMAGFTLGQTYTIRTAGSGVWITPETGEFWGNAPNWQQDQIAAGMSATADFASLDITEDVTVHLDAPRLLGNIVFGDTDVATIAGWRLQDDGMNALNLAADAGSPTITVDPLGGGAVATIDAVLNGSSGLIKAGTGTLVLTRPNTIAGPMTVSRGTLRIGPGGSLSTSTLTVAGNISALHVAGGTLAASGLTTLTPRNSEIVIDSGVARFDGGVTCTNTRDAIFRIRGGNVSAASINFPRTSDATINFGSGLLVQGGSTVIGPIGLGSGNSWGVMSVESGSLEVTGPLTVGYQMTSGRGGAFRVTGGEFRVIDEEFGIIMSRNPGTNPNNVSQGSFLGGVSTVEKFTLGFDPTVTAGSVTITINGGTLYLGSGGIVKNGSAGLSTNLNFISGLVGAKADWSTSLPITLPANGNIVIKAADAANVARDIMLDGGLTGAGGFTKTGSGRLRLGAANTFSGPVMVNSGLLEVSGSLGPGSDVTITSGGALTGTGAWERAVTLNPGGALIFGNVDPGSIVKVESVKWNAGGLMVFRLGSTSSQLAVKGNLTKVDSGVRQLLIKGEAGLAPGKSYTLVTFGSTDLIASDITISGLPPNLTGVLRVMSNSIVLDVIGKR